MKVVTGSGQVPVIYTAHHASHNFGAFADRMALTPEQQLRFSDYGTADTVPRNGIASIIAEHSRALGDLNRDPDDPGRFQAQDYGQPEKHDIWLPGQQLTAEEKHFCQQTFYQPFHAELVDQLRQRSQPTYVVAWDNTAHYFIGNDDQGQPVSMQPIILSNRGRQGSAQAGPDEPTSCDPEFLEQLAEAFAAELAKRELPSEIQLNLVMKGGYICRQYSSLRNQTWLRQQGISCAVQSLQVEYDTALTHDQVTLEPIVNNIEALRAAFSAAISSCF